ncbi:LysR family transcriptional regulator [Tsukamurella sp. 8F]|uniref:LysR family transcriptional regulator n=1 Tax=unclassified Tsukamurella TaxID=2633480 RepID=UPI0023B935E3|nr:MULTISPECIES: LysR family transcriptional regulator [unclassified Tsukamurella]MDF0529282.1 LysR family transcriptional regulator [Tsukamurella sp. 8J]MDF0586881.1 LysR family transcriptional regulator [Tsukamurella sp. 8F]
MSDVSIESLRLLVCVADLGSISAAARAIGIAQPSASARLRHLERTLRLDLLDRRTRGAELTDAGRAVTEWARAVTSAMDALETGAAALQGSHPVRVAASQTIAEYLVPAWLAQLRRETDEPVHLRVANSAGVVAAVRDHSADLGFVEGPTAPRDLVSRTIRTDRLALVVAPGHRLARRRSPVTAAELARLELVTREEGAGTRDVLDAALARAGETRNAAATSLDSNAAVKVMVTSGTHPAVLSELAVAADLRDGRLVEVSTEGIDLTRRLRAVRRRDAAPRNVVSTLLEVASGRRR